MKILIHNIFKFAHRSFMRIFRISRGSTRPVILNNHPAADQLRLIIGAAKEQAQNAQSTLGDIGSRIQNVIDGADATLPLVPYIDAANIEEIAILWSEVSRQTEHSYRWLEKAYPSTDSATGTVSLTSATISGIFSSNIIPYSADPSFHEAWGRYIEVTSRPTLKGEVISLIRTLHLDIAPGYCPNWKKEFTGVVPDSSSSLRSPNFPRQSSNNISRAYEEVGRICSR
jgi:hypothetical protein